MSQSQQPRWVSGDERRELGAALRRLLDVVVGTTAEPAELRAAAEIVEDLAARLASPPAEVGFSLGQEDYHGQMGLVGGLAHPIAPQLRLDRHGESAEGVVVMGPRFQGGPGLVHGGIIATLIDHAMGAVAAREDRPAMTAALTVRYRRPTPLGVPLTVSVRLDRIEGRKLHLSGTITAGGEVTAEADAIFLTLTDRNLQTVFGRRD